MAVLVLGGCASWGLHRRTRTLILGEEEVARTVERIPDGPTELALVSWRLRARSLSATLAERRYCRERVERTMAVRRREETRWLDDEGRVRDVGSDAGWKVAGGLTLPLTLPFIVAGAGDGRNLDAVLSPKGFGALSELGAVIGLGLDDGGRIAYWRDGSPWTTDAPGVTLASLAAGPRNACGVTAASQEIRCWGESAVDLVGAAPEGPFEAVDVFVHACALASDGSVRCWPGGPSLIAERTPDDCFQRVGVGSGFACGLRTDGRVRCWGGNDGFGQLSPP